MATALIMAGGRASRMRATNGPLHKALVPVLGVPVIERNLCALFGQGFLDIVVSAAADERTVEDYISGRGTAIANVCGAHIKLFLESRPLGTIGAARLFGERARPLLIVNVDNLSTINLRALVDAHVHSTASMTVASHLERFSNPFGELSITEGRITEYREKPDRLLCVSSGTYVLGADACERIGLDRPSNVPELIAELIGLGKVVNAFEHRDPWVDVNDVQGIQRAESIIADNAPQFELWCRAPSEEVDDIVVRSPAGILARRSSSSDHGQWTVTTQDASLRSRSEPLVSFDHIRIEQNKVVRHNVRSVRLERVPATSDDERWIPVAGCDANQQLDEISTRCLAWEIRRP